LLGVCRQPTLRETTQQRLITLIKQLGADDFETREHATKELIGLGAHARAALERAVNDPDAEVSARAKRCLAAIPARAEKDVRRAAVRVLAARRPASAIEALLAYLPQAQDEALEEEIVVALAALGVRDGRPDPALVEVAADKLPLRRLAAATALARAGDEHRAAA